MHTSPKQYFIALLPELNFDFYQKILEVQTIVHGQIKLPFHVTFFYLGGINQNQLTEVINWANQKATFNAFTANVNGIDLFKKEDQDYVFFLNIQSETFNDLNKEFSNQFAELNTDNFPYKSHLSLFYPQIPLENKQKRQMRQIFQDIKKLKFNKLALVSILPNSRKIEHLVELKD